MTVDSQFFKLIKSQDKGATRYEGYKSQYARSTMILFSKTSHTPLAALVFHAEDNGVLSLLSARPSPNNSTDHYFQGVLNTPNQVFHFSIINLNDDGFINFNILHTPHRVSEVDPGPAFGINQVNELKPNQGYTIPVDQRTKRAMVLAGLTKKQDDGTTAPMTVEETESKTEKKEGLYFYLSVVASAICPSLIAKFAEGTLWKCADHFVRKVNAPVQKSFGNFGGYRGGDYVDLLEVSSLGSARDGDRDGGGDRGGDGDVWVREMGSSDSMDGFSAPLSRGSGGGRGPARGTSLSGRNLERSSGRNSNSGRGLSNGNFWQRAQVSNNGGRGVPRNAVFRDVSAHNVSQQSDSVSRSISSEDDARGARDTSSGNFGSENVLMLSASANANDILETSSGSVGSEEDVQMQNTELFESFDVGTTQAGKLSYGRQQEVVSGVTGLDYAYEHPSEPTVICLSLHPSLKFYPLPDITAIIEEEFKEWLENEGKALIAALTAVYKSDTCCIDLDSPADTIICQCGHQCVNHNNVEGLTKCPMCRGTIAALVRADGLVM
jgi:hypothetical protein